MHNNNKICAFPSIRTTEEKFQTTVNFSFRKKERGQTMILGMVVIAVLAVLVVMVYGNTRAVQDKTELVNAADAAAYSAGVAVSRELNFLAYTNRAIIANHVTTGHLVSYKSWTKTLEALGDEVADFIDLIQSMFNWLGALFGNPTLGDVIDTDQVRAIAEFPDVMAGITTGLHIAVQQQLINAQLSAQQVTYNQLVNGNGSSHFVDEVMQDVANAYLGDTYENYYDQEPILINNVAAMNATLANPTIDPTVGTKISSIVSGQYSVFNGIVQEVETSSDGGRLNSLVEKSYQNLESSKWFTDRGFSLLGGLAERSGSTTTTLTDGVMGWQASDQYTALSGLASASGSATAKETCEGIPEAATRFLDFFRNNISGISIPTALYNVVRWSSRGACRQYTGIPRYYRLDDAFATSDSSITLNTFLSRSMGTMNNTYRDDAVAAPIMTVVAEVEIAHERPVCDSDCGADPINPTWGFSALESNREEYANLYNPFWRPALSDPSQM